MMCFKPSALRKKIVQGKKLSIYRFVVTIGGIDIIIAAKQGFGLSKACEKALRAAHFSKNANDVPGRTHSLRRLVLSLGQDLKNRVAVIEGRLNDHNMMRYPNSVSRPNIPSDLYTEDHANFALEKTKELLDAVEDEFNIH